jgi:NAD(P)-dependent dehydrogenase (short-subunit alcohol dehydrogenase family)
MTGSLAGRMALVTGAGRGIGRAIAIGLAQAGAEVLVTARSADQVAWTVAAIEAAAPGAGKASAVVADIADNRQRQELIDAALARGRVDMLINNAATVEPLGASAAIWAGDLRRAFEVNVIAPAPPGRRGHPGHGRGRLGADRQRLQWHRGQSWFQDRRKRLRGNEVGT